MLDMLSDPEVYNPIPSNSNPISTTQKVVNQILNQFVKDQKITVPIETIPIIDVETALKCCHGVGL